MVALNNTPVICWRREAGLESSLWCGGQNLEFVLCVYSEIHCGSGV